MSQDTDNSNTIYLVDGSSYLYRAFFGIRGGLSTSDGFPTNAVYGFTNMLQSLLEDHDPEYVAVAFDAFESDVPNFRKEMYEEYKANRDKMPEDLAVQVPKIRELVRALHIPILEKPGLEADDLIATAARKAVDQDVEVCIISADKDLMQLLGPHIRMHDTMRDNTYTPESVEEKYGVPPEKQRYVMAMSGDSSDNIPGVPGIGPKTGGKLIRKFGDLDGVYENIDKVGGKKRPKNLKEHEEQARLSLELVTLKDDCDIDFDLEDLRLTKPDLGELQALFDELEIQSPMDDIKAWLDDRGWLDKEQLDLLGPDSFDSGSEDSQDKSYRGIFEMDELEEVLEQCRQAERFGFDLETTNIDALDAEIVGMSFAWAPHEAVYVPVDHRRLDEATQRQLDRDAVLEKVAPLLEDADHKKVLQHWKYEWTVLKSYDIELRGVERDTMLMSYVLDPGGSHGLDALSREYLDYDPISYTDVAGSGSSQVSFDAVAIEDAIPYAAEDADLTLILGDVLAEELDDAEMDVDRLLNEIEMPLSRVLGIMERTGICVDRDILDELSREFEAELDDLRSEINELAGKEINPNSPTQLREVLFEDLDLPVKKRTKTGPSTAKDVLEQLSELHDLPELILEFRSFSKLKGTYVDALPELIRDDGRIHTSFNQAVTATGRLSSSDPNLQNIPIRTSRGRQIRKAFVPGDGMELIVADYSQIELRILAHLSQDPLLLEAYQEDRDIHTLTAAQVFDVDDSEVTKQQRELGKTINYGVLYGMGSRRLARDFDIPQSEASDYIDQYFERYSVVDEFFDELVENAYKTGYAETMFGRRRALPGLEGHGGQQAYAERAAVNTPIQGTAADIIKVAMVELQEIIDGDDLPMNQLLQVHDELVFEAKDDYVDEAKALIRDKMEGVMDLDVPLTVDIGTGPNWLEAK
jgi:DNA polymerase-1